MSSNQRKAETLGIAHGTANSLLRRNIIHHLLVQYGEHKCYRCGEWILTPEELSIDHKEPWEGRENGKVLFWDLENIGFSHKRCNRPHSGRVLIISPEGMSWCSTCQAHKAIGELSRGQRPNGLHSECKECRKRR